MKDISTNIKNGNIEIRFKSDEDSTNIFITRIKECLVDERAFIDFTDSSGNRQILPAQFLKSSAISSFSIDKLFGLKKDEN